MISSPRNTHGQWRRSRGEGRGGRLPPQWKYTWARVSFRPFKVLAEVQKNAPRMHHKSLFWDPKSKKNSGKGAVPPRPLPQWGGPLPPQKYIWIDAAAHGDFVTKWYRFSNNVSGSRSTLVLYCTILAVNKERARFIGYRVKWRHGIYGQDTIAMLWV